MASPARAHAAHEERLRLCDTLERVGPDAPTLCSPWKTRDLAAHLAWREGRFDLSPVRLASLVRGRASMSAYAAVEWRSLVAKVRSGPPPVSAFALPGVDAFANSGEFFIHHEDVLRATPGWDVRPLPPELEQALWKQLGLAARLRLRSAPVGIQMVAPGLEPKQVKGATNRGTVTVKGKPGELLLYASGRQRVAVVELDGREDAAAALAHFAAADRK